MKRYTFDIGTWDNMKLVSVFATNIFDAMDKLLPSSNPRLFSITKRMPMNGIVWR